MNIKPLNHILILILLIACNKITVKLTPMNVKTANSQSISIETAPDGNGSEINNLTLEVGNNFDLFAIKRSSTGNFLNNHAVSWSITGVTGTLNIQLGGESAQFVPMNPGISEIAINVSGRPVKVITVTVIPSANPALEVSNLTISNISTSGFRATLDFNGGSSSQTHTLYYCNNTASPGCVPTAGASTTMTVSGSTYTASVTGLTNPGNVFNVRVVSTDTVTVTGSPMNTTATLLYNNLAVSNLVISSITTSGFTATLDFSGGSPAQTHTLYYCNNTASPGCVPTAGASTTMTVSGSTYTASVTGLTNPGNVFNVRVVSTDSVTVTGSPMNTTATLLYNNLAVSNLVISSITTSGYTATLDFSGGSPAQTHTLYYCNNTASPGCVPTAGASTTMTVSGATYTAAVTGLTNPGNVFNVRVVSTDSVTVTGSPMNTTATLLYNNLAVSNLVISSITTSGYTATLDFSGGSPAQTHTLYYCNNTASPGCNPSAGSNISMTQNGAFYTVNITGLTNPGDVYNVRAVSADSVSVSGSPLNTTATLVGEFTKIFTFATSEGSDFTLSDSDSIIFESGEAKLKLATHKDDSIDVNGFGAALGTGVMWDSVNNYIRLNTNSNYFEASSEWLPKWNKVVAYWKLNESSGTSFADSSGFGHHGTGVGTLIYTQGKLQNAIDTSTSEISTSTLGNTGSNLHNGFSVSAWIKTSNTANNMTFFGTTNLGTSVNFQISINALCTDSTSSGAIKLYLRQSDGAVQCTDIQNTRVNDNQWHLLTITSEPTTSVTRIYLDGEKLNSTLRNSSLLTSFSNFDFPLFIGAVNNRGAVAKKFYGAVDELIFWSSVLSEEEILLIYKRQSPNRAGILYSRIFNAFGSQNWTNMKVKSTLPFLKELPAQSATELAADYSSISGNLTSGLIANWKLNETSGTTIKDWSGSNNHGTIVGSVRLSDYGPLNKAITFNGSTGMVSTTTQYTPPTNYSLQAWIKTRSTVGGGILGYEQNITGTSLAANRKLYITDAGNVVYGIYTTTAQVINSPTTLNDGKWHHIVATQSSTTGMALYIDGVLAGTGGATNPEMNASNGYWRFGNASISTSWPNYPSSYFFNGSMDDVAIWNRSLSGQEVRNLYRRGSNQVEYQFRICSTSDCLAQDSLVGKGWKGPNDTPTSYFSELYNSVDNDITKSILTLSNNIAFSNFLFGGSPLAPSTYFQYRLILASDGMSTICDYGSGNTYCSPEIKSVEVEPSHYDNRNATLTTKTVAAAAYTNLYNNTFSAVTSCAGVVKYILSKDGSTYYHHTGGIWTSSDGTYNESNTAGEISPNLQSFASSIGSGNLYIKIFLKSDGSTPCSIDSLSFSGNP